MNWKRNLSLLNQKKKTVRGLWVLYAVVLFIALIFLSMYLNFSKETLQSLSNTNTAFVKSVSESNNIAEDVLLNYATQIYYSSEVKRLRGENELSNFEVIEAMRSLNSLSSFCPFVETIYVYNYKQQYIYSTSDRRGGAISDYQSDFRDREALEMFNNITPQMLRTPIYRGGKYSSSSNNDHVYSYVMSDSGNGAMMINISTDWLNSLLFSDGICACIIDSNNYLVAHPSEYEADYFSSAIEKLPNKDEESEGYIVFSDGGEKKVLLYTNMDNRDWRYLRIENYSDCLGGLLRVQRLSFAVFGIVALIGLSAGVVLLIQVVFPFQKLSTAMDSAGLNEEKLTMEQLTEKLTNLLTATKNAEHLQDSLRQMMKNEAVYNILFGNERDYENLIKQYGLHLAPGKPIVPLLISGINLERYLSLAEDFGISAEGVVVSHKHTIILTQSNGDALKNYISSFGDLKSPYWVIIGKEETDWSKLPECYSALCTLYERRSLYPGRYELPIHLLENLSDNIDEITDVRKRLATSLKKGEASGSRELFNQFFDILPQLNYHTAHIECLSLCKLLIQIYCELSPEYASSSAESISAFEDLICRTENISEVSQQLEIVLEEILVKSQEQRNAQRSTLISEIIHTIDTKYYDPSLSSQSLADNYSISCAYLCRIFRQAKGISLAAYISKVRIEKACQLLSAGTKSVSEISTYVGIDNSQYFYVLFKKQTGMTPNEYRTKGCVND